MKSIVVTYPGYQTLPRGLKMLLVASESFFFGEAKTGPVKPELGKLTTGMAVPLGKGLDFSQRYPALGTVWRN